MIAKILNRLFVTLLTLIVSFHSRAAGPAEDDHELCRKNLLTLFAAIQAYRADQKDIPDWLSDLAPKYLRDPNTLICPSARRTGNINTLGTEDPKIATSYIYEFANGPIPKMIAGGEGHTMKEWKRQQMALIGSKVPMVRCHNHARVLNLTFDGNVVDGEGSWENALSNEVDVQELYPTRIFTREARLEAAARVQSAIPTRNPNAPDNLIDLSKFYNAGLDKGWHNPGNPQESHLGTLPHGIQTLAGIQFDIRGLIQLSSQKLTDPRFPLSVKNIKVNQKAARIHFLHSTGWSASSGTPVCGYVIHFADGEKREFTIRYGNHLSDWIIPSEPDSKSSVVAWSGSSPVNDQIKLNIYKSQWTNSEPDKMIGSIDFVCANNDPAPFLIAITAETL